MVTTQFVHITGAACAKFLQKYNTQVVYTNGNSNDFPHKVDSQMELAYCSWMNINKKPTNKTHFYSLMHRLLLKLHPKLWLMKFIYMATPTI